MRGGSEKNVKAAHLMVCIDFVFACFGMFSLVLTQSLTEFLRIIHFQVAAGTVVLKADFNRGYANKVCMLYDYMLFLLP